MFVQDFIKWIRLLYTGAFCSVKLRGGLSLHIVVSRGIRQGCPWLSYSIAIEPLLFDIRKSLTGLPIPTMPQHLSTSITAYADDVICGMSLSITIMI